MSMLRNQATALLRHEHLTTTVPNAKELRPFVERLITIAKRGLAAGEANGRVLTARRLVMHDLQDREVVTKLFDTIAPRFASRPGGYTRLLRLGFRRGDSAEVAQVELVGSEFDPEEARRGNGGRGGEAEGQGCRRPAARGGGAAARQERRGRAGRRRRREEGVEAGKGRVAEDDDAEKSWRKLGTKNQECGIWNS